MSFCPKCGAQNDNNAAFCSYCGSPLRKNQQSNYPQQKSSVPDDLESFMDEPTIGVSYPGSMNRNIGNDSNNSGVKQGGDLAYQIKHDGGTTNIYLQQQEVQRPAIILPTNRSLLKFILLSMVTFGIYGIVVMSGVSTDINTIATRNDGRSTMHYCLIYFLFSWMTLGIVPLIWYHNLSERVGNELIRRNISYEFGAGTFWLWGVLGSLLFLIGPFVYTHKLLTAMNLLSGDFNQRG